MPTFGQGLITFNDTWTQVKAAVVTKSLGLQYEDEGSYYSIFAVDNPIVYVTSIFKGTLPDSLSASYSQVQNDADKTDFLTNWINVANLRLTTPLSNSSGTPIWVTTTGSLPVTGAVNQGQAAGSLGAWPVKLTDTSGNTIGTLFNTLRADPNGDRRTVMSASILTTSGSQVLTWVGHSEWYLLVNVKGPVLGTNPVLQFRIDQVDPIDQTTTYTGFADVKSDVGQSLISASIDVLEVSELVSDTVKISWTVTGTNPIFSGVNVTFCGHGPGNAIEGQADVGTVVHDAPVPVAGVDGTNTVRYVQVNSAGAVIVDSPAANATPGYRFGDIALSAITSSIPVYHTTYNEPTASVQRSVVSTSTSDKPGSTGAAKVIITYYDISGSGPFTEEVPLNGTTAANTTASMAYIESMNVSFAGSVGSNVGTISLKNLINGAGVTVASIGANENQTLLAHHYVPLGKTCKITDMSCGINGGAGTFSLRTLKLNTTGSVELRLTEEFRESAQASTATRNFGTALQVTGPARVRAYVTTEANISLTYRAAFNFYDQ